MDPALLFTWITTQIDTAMQAGVQQNYIALIAALRPVVATGLIVWLAVASIGRLAGWNAEPVASLFRGAAIGAAVLAYCFAEQNYGAWARDVVMNGLAQPAMAVMATGAGAPPITGVAFDSLVARTLATGLDLVKTVGMAPSTWIMLGVVPLYFGISLLAICAAYLVWLLPHVILQLLVAIGPIACVTLAFPVTRSIFHGWARTCLSMVLLQLLLFALLTIVLAANTAVTDQVMTMAAAGVDAGSSQIAQLVNATFGAAAVNLLLGFAAISLPAVSAAITGGAYVSGMGVAGAAGSGASGAAERAAARAVAGGSAPQAAASPPRAPILPPGPAIWSSRP